MAAKGTNAKLRVEETLRRAFGDDYVGNVNSKIYVWANDGAEKVQIALAMTCPKVMVGEDINPPAHEFSATPPSKEVIDELMNKLGF